MWLVDGVWVQVRVGSLLQNSVSFAGLHLCTHQEEGVWTNMGASLLFSTSLLFSMNQVRQPFLLAGALQSSGD